MIESAKYTETGDILAVIDGKSITIPDDAANRHRELLADWEKVHGNEIEPFEGGGPRLLGTMTEFMDLFPKDIQAQMLAAAKQSPELELLLTRATASNQVDLSSDTLREAMATLVKNKVISSSIIADLKKTGFPVD